MSDRVYRIRSSRPLLWRTPHSLQVGVDHPRLVVDSVDDHAAPLVHALQDGISEDGYELLRRQRGVSKDSALHLLNQLSPAFVDDEKPQTVSCAVYGTSNATPLFARQLEHLGVTVTRVNSVDDLASHPGVVILLADYLLDPQWLHTLPSGDRPHVPVVFSDLTVSAGPLIIPGHTPCLSCRELTIRDEEPEWLNLGSQLWSTPSPHADPKGASVAAVLAAELLSVVRPASAPLDTSEPFQLRWEEQSGLVYRDHVTFHPQCHCRGL